MGQLYKTTNEDGEYRGGPAFYIARGLKSRFGAGLFSNEAGMGSAPNIAACATPQPHHPSSQGFVQALGVFIGTLVICTATALMILLSGAFEPGTGADGIALTQEALGQFIGPAGPIFIAVAILLFAFNSVIGNYTYAENTLTYLGLGGHTGRIRLRVALLAMVLWGSLRVRVGTLRRRQDPPQPLGCA